MTDTEKVSFNMTTVDLGKVDLLVEQGYYSSRTDFLKSACRGLLSTHEPAVQEAVLRRSMVIGVVSYDRRELERLAAKGRKIEAWVVGMLILPKDVTPDLARRAFSSLKVYGSLRASAEVKEALAEVMQ
jgi:Arc/MetJ-type ribon-helix-helix transcriptional regulator